MYKSLLSRGAMETNVPLPGVGSFTQAPYLSPNAKYTGPLGEPEISFITQALKSMQHISRICRQSALTGGAHRGKSKAIGERDPSRVLKLHRLCWTMNTGARGFRSRTQASRYSLTRKVWRRGNQAPCSQISRSPEAFVSR